MPISKPSHASAGGKPPFVLTLDLGSGSVKAAVMDVRGKIAAAAQAPVSTQMLPKGGAEQDPVQWWEKAKDLSRRVIGQSGVDAGRIKAVGCASQWSVVTPVDPRGRPLMNAVHWLDTRGGVYNRKIAAGFPMVQGYGLFRLLKWLKTTGLAPTLSGVDSLGHVLFIKHRRPEIYEKTHKFLEPMDYLTARLTGRITASQKTMAVFMVTDNRKWGTTRYSDELLNLAGLDKGKFPELIPNDGVVGPLDPDVAKELGLSPKTFVVAGVGDSNASTVGSGAVIPFETVIYVGTSYYLNCHVPFQKTDVRHMMISLPCPFENTFLLIAEQGAGGRCVERFLTRMVSGQDDFSDDPVPDDVYERFNNAAAQSPAGSNKVVFLPHLNGSIVPCEDPYVRGGFVNLGLNTTRSDMARAVMEGMALNSRWTLESAEKFISRPVESFRFSGGGALSDLWCRIHADVTGKTVLQVEDPVASTLRGAGFLALVSLGHLGPEDIPDLVPIKKRFEPNASNRAVYDDLFDSYKAFFKNNRKIFKALNRPST